MSHSLELVTALLGCCSVVLGSLCIFRLGGPEECSPEVERLSFVLICIGALAAVSALLLAAFNG